MTDACAIVRDLLPLYVEGLLSPESVAHKALRATFRGRRRCLPGLLTKIIGLLCAIAPAWALLPILKIPAVKRILERV